MSKSMQVHYIPVTAFWFIFRSNFPEMRLSWECHDQSQETNWRYCVTGLESLSLTKEKGLLKIDHSVKIKPKNFFHGGTVRLHVGYSIKHFFMWEVIARNITCFSSLSWTNCSTVGTTKLDNRSLSHFPLALPISNLPLGAFGFALGTNSAYLINSILFSNDITV